MYGKGVANMYPEPISEWPISRVMRIVRKISKAKDKENSSTT